MLNNKDIDRILKGGFPADDDTNVSRNQKRIGLVTDLQMKLDEVNKVLGKSGMRQTDNMLFLSSDEEDIVNRLLGK